jgi:threonine/homoserine/homoserine lactone efflux protein
MRVKWAEELYLIYLGIKTFFDKKAAFETSSEKAEYHDLFKIYKQGVITNVLYHKSGIIFSVFFTPVHQP